VLVPTAANSSESRLSIENFLISSSSRSGLRGQFEAPNLIVSIDKANPSKIIGNGYTAQLSRTLSTVFVFDVRPEFQGKTCELAFYMPPLFPFLDLAPVKIRSPGGITVSSVGQQAASAEISASNAGSSKLVGWVPSVEPSNQYNISDVPCAAGQRVAYQIESIGGLIMDFFQMTSPPLGLFMSVSG
jgi:glucan endo-1,3-beta-D-glucosidase